MERGVVFVQPLNNTGYHFLILISGISALLLDFDNKFVLQIFPETRLAISRSAGIIKCVFPWFDRAKKTGHD